MNQEEYRMIYDWKQQCYACDQSNHITSNCEALAMLINTEKMHQTFYENWFVSFEDNSKTDQNIN